MRRRRHQTGLVIIAAALVAATMSGCDYQGLNSLTLPGTKGTGSDAITVRVEISDAEGIVPNSPVLVDDLNVGTVRSINLDGDQPVITVSLEPNVNLPANATARIGQTSLLGAKHVELARPVGEKPIGHLENGDRIDEAHSSPYPSTEEVLAGVSTLLNGGGLGNIKTITTEVNKMLGGREDTVRSLLTNTRAFAASLDAQKGSISRAIDSMDVLAARVRNGNGAIDQALRDLPPALRVVRKDRDILVAALQKLGYFGAQTQQFLAEGGGRNLVLNLAALRPTLKGLADAGSSLTGSLNVMFTILFPLQHLSKYFRGDDVNLFATVDGRLGNLLQGLVGGTPLEGLLGTPNILLGQPLGTSNQAANPLAVPSTRGTLSHGGGSSAPAGSPAAGGTGGGSSTSPGPSRNPLGGLLSSLLGGSK